MELDRRPGSDPDHQQVPRRGHQCVGPGRDLRQQPVRIVVEEPEGGGEGSFHQRPHPVELGPELHGDRVRRTGVGTARSRVGVVVGVGGGSQRARGGLRGRRGFVPADGVEAVASASGTALGLADEGPTGAEDHRDLGEEAPRHLAQVGVPHRRAERGHPDQGVVGLDLEQHRLRGAVEMAEERADLAEDGPGRAGGEDPVDPPVHGGPEQCPADVEADGPVRRHQRGRVEQRGRLADRAPPPGVAQLGEGTALTGEGQGLGDAGITAPGADQAGQGVDDRSGYFAPALGVGARLLNLHGHRSLSTPRRAATRTTAYSYLRPAGDNPLPGRQRPGIGFLGRAAPGASGLHLAHEHLRPCPPCPERGTGLGG